MAVKQNNQETYYCVMQVSDRCKSKNGLLTEKDFYMASNNEFFKNGRVHICKECMKKYTYINSDFNLEKFKKILMMIDYPFYQVEFESAFNGKMETIGAYIKNIMLNHKGTTWGDGDKDYEKTIINNEIIEDEDDFEVTPQMVKFWGKGYSKEDLLFLQEYYHDLIRMYDHSLPVQVNNYRNMAKTQLQANKCLDNGDMGGYDKAMKILSMLSGDSNIKPVQENSTEKIAKGGFDMFVKHIEDDDPIPPWEKEFGMIDKFKYYLSIFFFGNLSRALNINNPFKDEFEKEMQEYTVDTSVVEEDMENQVDFLEGK